MLLKITEKVLLDRNSMYNFTIYRSHDYYYCLLLLLLYTVNMDCLSIYCTVIVTVSFQ